MLFGSTTASVLHRIYIKYIGQYRFYGLLKHTLGESGTTSSLVLHCHVKQQ